METDDRTSSDAFAPSEEGQAQTSPAPSSSGTQGQASGAGSVNLYESEEFRRYQSERDRREAEMSRRLRELEQEREDATLAGMDDYDKTKHFADKYKAEAEKYRAAYEERLVNEAKEKAVAELSTKYGIPRKLLESASGYKEAEERGKAWKVEMEQAVSARGRERDDKEARNAPYLGSGRGADGKGTSLEDAMRRKDSRTYYELLLTQND